MTWICSIIPDTTNPRHLFLQAKEIQTVTNALKEFGLTESKHLEKATVTLLSSISKLDPERTQKIAEIESLTELGLGISTNGLLNPITTYKEGENYVIIAGERRFLAHLLLGRKFVECRVFNERPSDLKKKLVQWLENIQREDLSLYSKIENVRHIKDAYKAVESKDITPTALSQVSGISLPTASRYLLVANSSDDVLNAIKDNKLQSILKAATIAAETDPIKRAALIDDVTGGASAAWITKQKKGMAVNKKGRPQAHIQFGTTKNSTAARKIIEAVVSQHKLEYLKKRLDTVNWDSYKDITDLFNEIVKNLEKG